MESENSLTKQYFTPDVDYVSFDSKADMLDKVRYYLEHEDERQEIAYNGYRKATTEHNHQVFWNRVMDKLAELKVFPAPPPLGPG
jgi:spore maturation protein CgeB